MSDTTASLDFGRRTTADTIFDSLRDDIVKMRLRPGTRLSEAEVAKLHDISRQPVREAFIRLDNLRLLHIRPQRATVVRPMSNGTIKRARFMRLSVELEVARRACSRPDDASMRALQEVLQQQLERLETDDLTGFHQMDSVFHAEICRMAGCECAIEVITDCKATVDRLCILSLKDVASCRDVYSDHAEIVEHLADRNCDSLLDTVRRHLARLNNTIAEVQRDNPDYFED